MNKKVKVILSIVLAIIFGGLYLVTAVIFMDGDGDVPVVLTSIYIVAFILSLYAVWVKGTSSLR